MKKEPDQIQEVIIVEGRYDKSAIHNVVQATVFETSGFGIFSDKEKISLVRKLADKRGIIILTDSDRAGFFIRGRLTGMLNDNLNIKHAYIPDIKGREKRKTSFSKEGKLGVEAMSGDVILTALKNSGATFINSCGKTTQTQSITMNDLFEVGLSGSEMSAKKRRLLLQHLDLPARLSSKKLLAVLNILLTKDEFLHLVSSTD